MSQRKPMGIILALALALVACGGQSVVGSQQHSIYVHGESLLPRGGLHALIQGTLAVRDGCVVLEGEDVDEFYPVIWPSGTSIAWENPLTLELPAGQHLGLGQVVTGGGGFHAATSVQVEVDIPIACIPETGEVAVFNPDEAPTLAK